MVDGEAVVMMMATISSKSPSRQGARTELLIPVLGFSVAAELGSVFGKSIWCLAFLGRGEYVVKRASRVAARGSHT